LYISLCNDFFDFILKKLILPVFPCAHTGLAHGVIKCIHKFFSCILQSLEFTRIKFDVEVTKLSPVQSKEVLGSIMIKLYDDINPLTCQNFQELATGQHGYGYEGTLFNHVIPGCLIQAGHVVTPSGHRG